MLVDLETKVLKELEGNEEEPDNICVKVHGEVEDVKLQFITVTVFMQGFCKLKAYPELKLKHESSLLLVIAFITKPTPDEKVLVFVPSVNFLVYPAK